MGRRFSTTNLQPPQQLEILPGERGMGKASLPYPAVLLGQQRRAGDRLGEGEDASRVEKRVREACGLLPSDFSTPVVGRSGGWGDAARKPPTGRNGAAGRPKSMFVTTPSIEMVDESSVLNAGNGVGNEMDSGYEASIVVNVGGQEEGGGNQRGEEV